MRGDTSTCCCFPRIDKHRAHNIIDALIFNHFVQAFCIVSSHKISNRDVACSSCRHFTIFFLHNLKLSTLEAANTAASRGCAYTRKWSRLERCHTVPCQAGKVKEWTQKGRCLLRATDTVTYDSPVSQCSCEYTSWKKHLISCDCKKIAFQRHEVLWSS